MDAARNACGHAQQEGGFGRSRLFRRAAPGQPRKQRFVGSIEKDGKATVRLRSVSASHALARLHLTDNLVQFSTARYTPNPLIVQGPGAGPEVTAAGIFADLLR